MRRFISLALLALCCTLQLMGDKVTGSTTLPADGKPEHVYTMVSGGGYYCNPLTAPTQTADNYGLFAFYPVDGLDNTYYIYSYKAKKWLSFTKAGSYNNGRDFVQMTDEKTEGAYFYVYNYADDNYQIAPYNTSGPAAKYLNWYQGISQNPVDGTNTLGLWQDAGAADNGSRWTFSEVVIEDYVYTFILPEGVTVTVGGNTYGNGDQCTCEGALKRSDVTVSVGAGQFATVSIDDVARTVTVNVVDLPEQAAKQPYTQAVLYPAQQTAVGAASLTREGDVYTLQNNVLAASFMKVGSALYFAGSKAMDLQAGTEPFTVGFGSGDAVPASGMTLVSLEAQDLAPEANAVGGAEHYAGKALVARYDYTYKGTAIQILWKAVLRDGSHYLRTEMELTGVDDVDMYNVIPLLYNVDTKLAGSTPAVVGNTRGAVLMSNKIFAGLENPVAYNTVGGATGEEDKWELDRTLDNVALTAASWTQVAEADVPGRVTEATGAGHPNVYAVTQEGVALTANQRVEITVTYTSGNHRLNFGGADLLDANGSVAANDYHSGFSGNQAQDNTFSFIVPNDGTYTLRVFAQNATEEIDASSTMSVKVYNAKAGVVVSSDIVGIQGLWSRNTTLAAGETWKISGVVGLIAQDGTEGDSNIHKTQKRRSFLAYSERERAVPWRPNPAYISWYELNINRNNAQDPTQNMTADQVLNVLNHWKSDFYNRYGVGPNSFVIDDGWDNYGTWTFHANFPNEMKDMAALAAEMGAGVGAWLGPVGGYGTSGNYRRQYWSDKGGMVLSNPAYYKVFKDAAYNLTQNQGDFRFFKFDGISAQFSATGPDAGDTGNENAEGIIRLERYVREELKRDIFFNTTVGTWASPFWYHYTDATWRQENDYGTIGNNSIDRENWITYRDRLVYQNYVTNSPICPINTLMTHGFILSQYGSVSKDMSYEAARRELRAAFVCGSGMVELYNDYPLMNSINNGKLWADLAECISWQKRNADVLPDAHWVGGNPWNGSAAQVYGWASWNGTKSTLALRNGANDAQTYNFTLREALNIPANVDGSIVLRKSFAEQDALAGLTEGEAISIDQQLSVTLPGSSIFSFDGLDAAVSPVSASAIALTPETAEMTVEVSNTYVVKAAVSPAETTFPALAWSSSDESVATVSGGLVVAKAEGEVTITATALDGSGVSASIVLHVVPKVVEPYYINYDKDVTPSRTDRAINSINFEAASQEVKVLEVGDTKAYYDFTADEDKQLVCKAGDEITVTFNIKGGWMNGYVYIDLANDGQFDFIEGSTDQTGTDVVSFSFYTGSFENEDQGVNSAGTEITGTARNTMMCPSFTAPSTVGTYRIRFKMDWNSVDPAGQLAADGTPTGDNGILANGGCIVDALLRVDTRVGIEDAVASEAQPRLFDLCGRRIGSEPAHGVYIRNNQKVVK
ncbi:MAG: Ig-like domain-containing protein [Alloprevotella sp.]